MGIYNVLYDYQKDIVDKYKDRNSLGLFLDMGLGKTPLALALCEINDVDNILIITLNNKTEEGIDDKGSRGWWAQKLDGFTIYNKSQIKKLKDEDKIANKSIFIINYESVMERQSLSSYSKSSIKLKSYIKKFISSSRNKKVALILDESHKIKTTSSLLTKSLFKIKDELDVRSNTLYSYLLTGTPFTNGYIDLLTQLQFLGLKMTKMAFVDTYCVRGNIKGLYMRQQPIVGYKNVEELYKLVHNYAITIKSESVISLPKQIFTYIKDTNNLYFKLYTKEKLETNIINTELEKRALEPIIANSKASIVDNPFYRNIDYPSNKWLALESSANWLRARQISIGFQGNKEDFKWFNNSRLLLLSNFLKDNPDNYVLFYNFTPELIEIFNIAEELGYNVDVYCGEIKSLYFYEKYIKETDEQKLLNKKNIILANFASGSTGMNWQEYNKCIVFSIPFYKDYEQALKRIHRIGQKETTFYYIFEAENWLDKSMLNSLKEKEQYDVKIFEKNFFANN